MNQGSVMEQDTDAGHRRGNDGEVRGRRRRYTGWGGWEQAGEGRIGMELVGEGGTDCRRTGIEWGGEERAVDLGRRRAGHGGAAGVWSTRAFAGREERTVFTWRWQCLLFRQTNRGKIGIQK